MIVQIPLILEKIFSQVSKTFFRIAFAILIFLFGFIIGKIVERLLFKMLKEIEINKFIKNTAGLKINADTLISHIVSYAIYFLSLVSALEQLGLANFVLYLLSGAVIIIILLSFFLAIRDFLPNLISGIYLYRKENIRKGANIEVNGIKGELKQIDLLQIKIETKNGDIIYIPNSVAAKSNIKIKKN